MIICVQEVSLHGSETPNVIFVDTKLLDQNDPLQKQYYDAIQEGIEDEFGIGGEISNKIAYSLGNLQHAVVALPVIVENSVSVYYGA